MKNTVENKFIGKLFRTTGFVLLAFGGAVILVTTLLALFGALGDAASSYTVYADKANEILEQLKIPNLLFYSHLAAILGSVLLVMTLSKGIVSRFFHVLLALILTIYLIFGPQLSPIFVNVAAQRPQYIVDFATQNGQWFTKVNDAVPYVGLIGGIFTVLYVMLTSVLIGNKRPRRISTGLVSGGFGTIIILIITAGILAPLLKDVKLAQDLMSSGYYLIFQYSVLSVSLVLEIVGAIIGSIFFFLD